MLKIGFIDLFLDEWHAHHYPQWIRDSSLRCGIPAEAAYAWAETDKPGGLDTASFCKTYGLVRMDSAERLAERADAIIVLAPDHPETHERLAAAALRSGKPVYVDKTFSPDLAAGRRLFDLAARHGTPMFSSSALRFAREFAELPEDLRRPGGLERVSTTGGGNFRHYCVHQFEMVTALLGTGASRVKSLSGCHTGLVAVEYPDGRSAVIQLNEFLPFQAMLQRPDGSGVFVPTVSDIFERMFDAMLPFFAGGESPVPQAQTLEVMALVEASLAAMTVFDTWVDLPGRE